MLPILFVLVNCIGTKAHYRLPDEMLPHVKNEYAGRCEKGYYLYQANCASCHNVKIGRKEYIPDFTEDQMRGYSIRVSNALHERSMPDSLVSEEELILISTFLQYKIKNPGSVNQHIRVVPSTGSN